MPEARGLGRISVRSNDRPSGLWWRRQQAGEREGMRPTLLLLRAGVDDMLARVDRQLERRRRARKGAS